MKKVNSKNDFGITLIALIITIVVLLILAGISLSLVAGGDGIISKASNAVGETVKSGMKEQIEMYVSEATYDYYLNNPDNKSYLEFMGEYLANNPNMRSNENVDVVVQDDAEVIFNYTQGKNVVQMSLSSDGIVDIVGSGTTEGGIEDTYAPKISYDASTTSSITVTLKDASGVVAYACLTSSTKPEADSADWVTIAEAQTKQVTITGLTGNQTYYVFAKDKAGNISEGKVCKTIPYEEIKFTTVQSGSKFTVTVTAPTDTSNIVYQIGDDGTQTQYTGAFEVASGNTLYIWNTENKDATLKSKALFANVTVTYNKNGGEGELPENIVTQHKQTVTVDTSKVLTKTGYTFLGWALTDDATSGIKTFEAPATNTTLYAVWSIKSYTVTLNTNEYGTLDKSSIGVNYGTTCTASGNELRFSDGQVVTATPGSYTGYTATCTGWSNTSGAITEDRTITANFSKTANTYIVTFDANEGEVSILNKEVKYGFEYGELPLPTKNGCDFLGWGMTKDSTTYITSTNIVSITANQTLYAIWSSKIPTNGLVAEYLFDGNVNDTSGNGYNLIASNVSYPKGVKENCIYSMGNGYIYRNSNPLGASNAFTISFDCLTYSSNLTPFILLRDKTWNFTTWNGEKSIIFDVRDLHPCLKISDGTNVPYNYTLDTVTFSTNTWYHIAYSWDGKSGSLVKLYLNGNIINSVTSNYTFSDGWASDYMMEVLNYGTIGSSYSNHANAKMDNLRLYNRVLSDDEIKALAEE